MVPRMVCLLLQVRWVRLPSCISQDFAFRHLLCKFETWALVLCRHVDMDLRPSGLSQWLDDAAYSHTDADSLLSVTSDAVTPGTLTVCRVSKYVYARQIDIHQELPVVFRALCVLTFPFVHFTHPIRERLAVPPPDFWN